MTTKWLSMIVALLSFLPTPSRAISSSQDCDVTAADAGHALRSDAIESVSPVYRNIRSGRHLYGVAITYRPGADVTASEMQETLDSQIARGRYHPSAESPLNVNSVGARVHAERDRLRVEIISDNATSAKEALGRTRRLAQAASK